ncbi:winged helix-turn-helix transcriptional regulator [Streptomyces sp. NPDC019890]|uniref:winged helix-turn-helix transcriptional regulator n=1 Tax=Streptomyces sp. NPDC019890 TaxID=3365064 RepID=UPI00384D944E
MATTGLPRTTLTDLSRVTESLEMITPRWSVWVLMTLSAKPLRYAEIKPKLPWLADGQLHPRLRKLTDAGLVERTEYAPRHVTYGLTARGADLMPVLTVIAAWGNTHLEKDLVVDKTTGKEKPERIPPAQNIEDTLTLLTPRHATPILWALQARGATSAKSLAAVAMPDSGLSAVYPPLRQLVDDGLVEAAGEEATFQLSEHGRALAPIYGTVSAWAAGRPLAEAAAHPVWGHTPAPSQTGPGTWITNQSRLPAPPATAPAAPALSAQPAPATWQTGDLFSHQIPARPIAISPAGGHRR